MGTKNNPGKFDCYHNALPDEPMFVLLARDPDFARLVREWASRRGDAIACGDRPQDDFELVVEALECACAAEHWRLDHIAGKREGGVWK